MTAPPHHLLVVRSTDPDPATEVGDDELMLLVGRDNIQGFEALVTRHHEMVMGFACRFLGDRDLGEEVAQEVFLALWAERKRYQAKGRFQSYLLTLAYNRCHVFARRRQRHQKKVANLQSSTPVPAPESTPLDKLIESARADQLRDALAKLPEPMRRALVLRYNSGLNIKEIAETTGAPTGTVKSNLFRGLKRLHELFTGGTP